MPSPLLSILLVSYQSQPDLARLFPTLLLPTSFNYEVLVVDNCPGDGTAQWIARHYPQVQVIPCPSNPGYAGGNNLGLGLAQGQWCLILNPDTELHRGALEALVAVAQAHPTALITPKLLQPDGSVNAVGLQMHYTGITSCRGLGQSPASYTGTVPTALVSGAAFIAPTEALRKLGGFDPDYQLYHEEVDLSLRARLAGYEVLCAQDATITHHYRLNLTPRKFGWLERNRLLTLLKVLENRTLGRMAPALVLTELATWAFALLKGPAYLKARIEGYRWLWQNRAAIGAKHRAVQASRTIPDAAILGDTLTGLPFDQLVGSPKLARLLENLSTPLYRLAHPHRKN
jgi:hypothetical protein